MTSEIQTIIKLRYPDPDADFKEFAFSLPDEVIERFYEGHAGSAEIKRRAIISYWYIEPASRPRIRAEAYQYLEEYEQLKS